MIILFRESLEKRDASSTAPIIWILPPIVLLVVIIFFYFLRALRYRGQQRANTAYSAQQSETGIKGFFRRFVPHSYYNADLSSTRQHSSVHTARPSTDFFSHELQNEEEQRGNRMSSNRLSVRSIMTLPPYHVSPLPSERLIAREGEREGVDTVVEYPESDTEAEERREEEMQTLYNIREARRRENEERAARRAERRAAVAQRDWRRVHDIDNENRLRSEARAASTTNAQVAGTEQDSSSINLETGRNGSQPDSALLIAQLHSLRDHNSRNRRVSSVSYADLGVARHDGSRLRADSTESDRRPLLDSAASIGGQEDRSRASSIVSGRSVSRSRATLQVSNDRRPSPTGSFISQRDGALTPQSMTDDLPPEPPSYEDDLSVHGGEVPPYEGPAATIDPEIRTVAHTDATHVDENALPPTLVIHPVEENQLAPARTVATTPPLHLNTMTTAVPPSIEVVQATPVVASSQFFPLDGQ